MSLNMWLGCVFTGCIFAFCVNADANQCRACTKGWCECSENSKTMQCEWTGDRPIKLFEGCGDYEVLVLHPERTYIPKSSSLLFRNLNPKRSLYKDFFFGLDGLKKLIINRHCIIENDAFFYLKNLEELEIIWKNRLTVPKTEKYEPISGDEPVLFKNSLANVPYSLKLYVSKVTYSIMKNSVKTSCSINQAERDFSKEKERLSRNLDALFPKSSAHQNPRTSALDSRVDESQELTSARKSIDSCMKDSSPVSSHIEDNPATRFHTMSANSSELTFGSHPQNVQLKRTISADRSQLVNCDTVVENDFERPTLNDRLPHTLATGDIFNQTLGSRLEILHSISCRISDDHEVDDAASPISSEDPIFDRTSEIGFEFSFTHERGGSFSTKPAMGVFEDPMSCNLPDASFPPVPLTLVSECPLDIDEMLTAKYLFNHDVRENIGVPANPSLLMGRFGVSIFAKHDNWII